MAVVIHVIVTTDRVMQPMKWIAAATTFLRRSRRKGISINRMVAMTSPAIVAGDRLKMPMWGSFPINEVRLSGLAPQPRDVLKGSATGVRPKSSMSISY